MNEVPVPRLKPPVAAANQAIVEPAFAVAPSMAVTGPGPHTVAGVVVKICGSDIVAVATDDGEAAIGVPPQETTHRKSVVAFTAATV